MYTLKHLILGNVIDVIHSARSNRVYLVLDPGFTEGDDHFLVPLLCPVCGQPWHFIWSDTPERLAAALKKSLTGFQLVDVKYFAHSSAKNIAETMEKFSLGSVPSELFIEGAADHIDENGIFPVIALSFEQRIASQFPSADDLRRMSPDDVRNELDLDVDESIDKAIRDVEKWMASDDYDDFQVEDDIFLAVHPSAILDAILVEPEQGASGAIIYPYQVILKLVEVADFGDDESPDEDTFE